MVNDATSRSTDPTTNGWARPHPDTGMFTVTDVHDERLRDGLVAADTQVDDRVRQIHADVRDGIDISDAAQKRRQETAARFAPPGPAAPPVETEPTPMPPVNPTPPADPTPSPTATLTVDHAEYLAAAAVDVDLAVTHGVRSTDGTDLPAEYEHLTGTDQAAGILFAWRSPDGRVTWQLRPDQPAVDDRGRAHKYLWPKGTQLALDVTDPAALADPDRPVLVVEGTKQHLAAASHAGERFAVVGMVGCQGTRATDTVSGRTRDMTGLDLAKRNVVLMLDGDIASNREVWDAAKTLADYLVKVKGVASVRHVALPVTGTRGLDDLLADEPEDQRAAALETLVASGGQIPKRPPAAPFSRFYIKDMGGLFVADLADALVDEVGRPVVVARGQANVIAFPGTGRYERYSRAVHAFLTDALGNAWRVSHKREVLGYLADHRDWPELPRLTPEHVANFASGAVHGIGQAAGMHLVRHADGVPLPTLFMSPVQIATDATCPHYDEWIIGRVGPDRAVLLDQLAGQMLDLGITPERHTILKGPSKSGKSTWLRLIGAIAGTAASVSLYELANDRFAGSDLFGHRLNYVADMETATDVKSIARFKQVTGDDQIRADGKWQLPFNFTAQCLCVFSVNDRYPRVPEASKAYLNRLFGVAFPHTFAGHEDPKIEAAMTAELPGIARRFLMAHHIRLRRPDRAWHTGPDIEADQAELARESNAVSEYLSTMTVTDPTVEGVTPTVLYASYRVWCESNQARPLGRNTFLAAIRKYTPTIPEWKLPGGHPLAGQRRFRVRLISDE